MIVVTIVLSIIAEIIAKGRRIFFTCELHHHRLSILTGQQVSSQRFDRLVFSRAYIIVNMAPVFNQAARKFLLHFSLIKRQYYYHENSQG